MSPAEPGKCRKAAMAPWATALLIAVLLCVSASARPRIKNGASGREYPCAFITRGGGLLVSVTDICEGAGFSWKWDIVSQKLTCIKKGSRLIFVPGMPFYLANDTLRQMAGEPVRDGGMLYLPIELSTQVFSSTTQDSIAWRAEDSTFIVSRRNSAETEKKPAAKDTATILKIEDTTSGIKQPQKETLKTIVIDPGHGGMDPGAVGPGGLEEKKIVLEIALALRDQIEKKPGLSVYLTRDRDKFIPLVDRTRFANDRKADIFVSLHANSIEGNKKRKEVTRGYKVYFLSQAKNEEDKLVAMRENAVIELEDKTHKYDNLQDILIDMAGNEFLRESQDLSIMITETFSSSLKKIPRLHLGVGQANFWVLNGTYMPSVLIEVGFISNPEEESELKDGTVQKSIAAAIFDAIMSFKSKYEEGK
jgi:N-acetylmuramoyl-L-alanine amidase